MVECYEQDYCCAFLSEVAVVVDAAVAAAVVGSDGGGGVGEVVDGVDKICSSFSHVGASFCRSFDNCEEAEAEAEKLQNRIV